MSAPIIPSYAELPKAANGLACSWGVFGDEDQLGTLNRLTDRVVLDATRGEVRTGERISVSLPVTEPDPGFFGRRAPVHRIFRMEGGAQDDVLDGFYPQGSSQWDGFRHRGDPELGYYGGVEAKRAASSDSELGVGAWSRRGIVGRCVLVDLVADAERNGEEWNGLDSVTVDVARIERALAAQRVQLRAGDVLLMRTGYLRDYRAADAATRASVREIGAATGLGQADELVAWLWDSGLAAVALDNPAAEVSPRDAARPSLHLQLIPMLGFVIGEWFDLEALAARCAEDGRYSGLLVSVPLNLPAGVGTPANALVMR